jgi:hypothetical protein
MLTIRKEQIRVFDEMAMKQFIERMVIYVRKHFPEESKSMDGEQLKNHICDVIPVAKKYGLVSERDICKYINLSMFYGTGFDKKPENDWMARMLMDSSEPNPSIRIRKLYKEVLNRLEEKA